MTNVAKAFILLWVIVILRNMLVILVAAMINSFWQYLRQALVNIQLKEVHSIMTESKFILAVNEAKFSPKT